MCSSYLEKQRQDEVETLRKNGDNLKLKLKEAIDAHDQTVLASKNASLRTSSWCVAWFRRPSL